MKVNKITGPNAGGPRQFPIPTHWPPTSVAVRRHMSTFIYKTFLEEPKLRGRAFRLGFLAFLFALTVFSALTEAHLSPSASGRYFGFIVPPSLLLNHLAFQFRWAHSLQIGLRVGAIAWCGVVLVYTLNVVFAK